jgi:uncharacterized protein YbjQ (UPF0145 family)
VRHPFLPDRPVDDAASLAALAAGGLPLRAQRRIAESRAAERPVFTSTLSPAESVVARSAGMAPVAQVMGSSIVDVTMRQTTAAPPGEIAALTQAFEQARVRALSRMQQEAALLGAHAVIDVRFEGAGADVLVTSGSGIEFMAIGTAIRVEGMPPAATPPPLTMLRADEVVKLVRAGYAALGLAIGNCFYYDGRGDSKLVSSPSGPVELAALTGAWHTARDLAVARFQASAEALGAEGVIGTKLVKRIVKNPVTHTQLSLEIVLVGTAVARNPSPPPLPRPLVVVDLAAAPRPSQEIELPPPGVGDDEPEEPR